VRLDKVSAGLGGVANLDLVEAGAVALEGREERADPGVRDEAGFDLEEAVALAADVADVAELAAGGEAEVVAVGPGMFGADDRADYGIAELPDATELFADDGFLGGELGGVTHVLELAAAAFAEEGAGGFHAVRGGFDDAGGDSLEVVGVLAFDLGLDEFAGGRERDEGDAAVRSVGEAGAAEDTGLDAEREEGWFGGFLVALAAA
jgi:hypothetical protein